MLPSKLPTLDNSRLHPRNAKHTKWEADLKLNWARFPAMETSQNTSESLVGTFPQAFFSVTVLLFTPSELDTIFFHAKFNTYFEIQYQKRVKEVKTQTKP